MKLRRKHSNQIMSSIKCISGNTGSTLIEMVVSFALIGIFMVCAGSVIVEIVNLYYDVKGRTYANQVSDIILEKVSSEIEGAKYDAGAAFVPGTINNPVIGESDSVTCGNTIQLKDKTDAKVTLSINENGFLEIRYEGYGTEGTDSYRKSTTWRFDKNVYDGFSITDFKLVRGDGMSFQTNKSIMESYGIDGDVSSFDKSVIAVLLTINSPKYGDYKYYRFVKMYNVPGTY
ncbi:MAG: hypothetical protein IKS48_09205 [Eubacterium sp.]|nr:hypothetical protein [Eubacterium sp.]